MRGTQRDSKSQQQQRHSTIQRESPPRSVKRTSPTDKIVDDDDDDSIQQTHDSPLGASTADAIKGRGTMATGTAGGVKHTTIESSAAATLHEVPAYPPSTRTNDKYKQQGSSSRGSSNTKRTSLLASAANPPSTTKKNEASMAAAMAGITSLRRLVTPPIVAKAMHDTPSTLQQQGGGHAAGASDKEGSGGTTKDPSKLEYGEKASNDETREVRTLLAPANKGKSGAGGDKSDSNGADAKRNAQQQADEGAGIFSWTDAQLAQHYVFEKEIGFGNWGSVWLATPRRSKHAKSNTQPHQVAIKLVHRQGTPASNARVKAIWNETKILRSCGKPVHENLVNFKEFVITPSYALVVMDYYRQPMNVALPKSMYAGPGGYFHQLLDSINWLHERNVTHCDIKVANLLVDTRKDKLKGRPILVDFGFATLHDGKTKFMSNQSWGTPEYLSPERNRGDYHDERLSDVWALGVTFFEIATGRTPFEHEDEQFLTKEQLDVYYKRTLESEWVGSWTIPDELESLCRRMLAADAKKRIYCNAALAHPFFGESFTTGNIGDIDESLMRELESGRRHSTPQVPVSPQTTATPLCVTHDSSEVEKRAHDGHQDSSVDKPRTSEESATTDVEISTTDKSGEISQNESAAQHSSAEKHNEGANTVDAGMARSSERSIDSQASNMRQKTSNALQMLKSPFKRNKKRDTAYPPSAFQGNSKQQRASSGTNRNGLHRRSSEGAASALKEHSGKRKNYSTQDTRLAKKLQNQSITVKTEKSVEKEHATVDDSGTRQTASKSSMTYTLDVDVSTSALDAYIPLDKEGFSEDVANTSFHSIVKDDAKRQSAALLDKTAPSAAAASDSKQTSPVDKDLPAIGNKKLDEDLEKKSEAKEADLHSFRPSRPPKIPKTEVAVAEPVNDSVRAASPTLEQIRRFVTQPALPEHVTAEDLAVRLADLSLLTKRVVEMVQETQIALQKLQERQDTQASAKSGERPASVMVTKAGAGEGTAATSASGVDNIPHQVQLRVQSPFRSLFRTSEVMMPRSALASPQPESEGQKGDLGVSSAVLVNQANWQLSAFDRARQTPFAGMASSDIVQAPSIMARDFATVDHAAHRLSQAEHSVMRSPADITFGQYASHDTGVPRSGLPPQSGHFFDDGSHEDLETSLEVRNLRNRQNASNAPSSSTPVRKSSLRALRKSPSDTMHADTTPIAWPEQPSRASVRVDKGSNDTSRSAVLSRTYESNGRMDKSAASPTPTQRMTADRSVPPRAGAERKSKLSKVKSFTLGRSNSLVAGSSGRGGGDATGPRTTSPSHKRNTLVETDKVYVIAAGSNGQSQSQHISQATGTAQSTSGFVRTRLASLKGLGSRRPSFSRAGNASRDDVTLSRTSIDVKSNGGDGGSPPRTAHGSTYARRGSNARRPLTPQPPLLGQRSPTKAELQNASMAGSSSGAAAASAAAALGSPTTATPGGMHASGTALWRILASKVQARR